MLWSRKFGPQRNTAHNSQGSVQEDGMEKPHLVRFFLLDFFFLGSYVYYTAKKTGESMNLIQR